MDLAYTSHDSPPSREIRAESQARAEACTMEERYFGVLSGISQTTFFSNSGLPAQGWLCPRWTWPFHINH